MATFNARTRMGDVQILDPYGVVTGKLGIKSATFNPLDLIDKDSPTAMDEVKRIANSLVIRQEGEKEPHWPDVAEESLTGLIGSTVCYGIKGESRSLWDVDRMATNPKLLEMAIDLMLQSSAYGGALAHYGGRMKEQMGEEKASTLSTLSRFLSFMRTPIITANLRVSSFDPSKLKRGKMTVYIVLPPEHMKAQMGWLRVIINAMITAPIREGPDEKRKVHYILDESASLGAQLDSVEDLLDKYRKYGCRAQFYYQSVGQLMKCWPKDQGQTLMSNCSKVFAGTSDIQTSQLQSSMLGKTTILSEGWNTGKSGGTTAGWSSGVHNSSQSGGSKDDWSRGMNTTQIPRELLKPEEILTLPTRWAITFPGGGMPPVLTYMLRYFEEPGLFRGQLMARFKAACRTLIGSIMILVIAVVLASMLTVIGKSIDYRVKEIAEPTITVYPKKSPGKKVTYGGRKESGGTAVRKPRGNDQGKP